MDRELWQMKKIGFVLLMALACMQATASSPQWSAQTTARESISSATLHNLLTKASKIWSVSVEQLQGEYDRGTLKITPLEGNWYTLERTIDGGMAILNLEDIL